MSASALPPRRPSRVNRVLLLLPVLPVLWGVAYVNVSELIDHRRFPQVGTSFDVGGRKLNIFCNGSGTPTVVFESGFDWPGYSWAGIQTEIAKSTRACWYDRAGNGWSDPGPGRRYSDSVANDLHRLLASAQVAAPYILVGHSLGGFHVREFNALYPGEVVGLVLIDPSNEDMAARIPQMPRGGGPNAPPIVVHIVDAVARQTGLWRWFMRDQGPKPDSVALRDWKIMTSLRRQRKMIIAASHEAPERGSADVVRKAGGLDSVPLAVIVQARPIVVHDSVNLLPAWISLNQDFARRSRRGWLIVAEGAGHFVQFDRPGLVVDVIRDMIDTVRPPITSGIGWHR